MGYTSDMTSFSNFIQDIDEYTTKEMVALAIYYLESYNDQDSVTPSEVESLLTDNRISYAKASIMPNISRLLSEGKIIKLSCGNGPRYATSQTGISKLENLSEVGIGTPPPEELSKSNATEVYEELYEETKEIRDELKRVRAAARKWRRRSWLWRVISFLIGLVIGTGLLRLGLSYI